MCEAIIFECKKKRKIIDVMYHKVQSTYLSIFCQLMDFYLIIKYDIKILLFSYVYQAKFSNQLYQKSFRLPL